MSAVQELEQSIKALRAAFMLRCATKSYVQIGQEIGIHPVTLSHFAKGRTVTQTTMERIARWIDEVPE